MRHIRYHSNHGLKTVIIYFLLAIWVKEFRKAYLKKSICFLKLHKHVYFHQPKTSLTGFKVVHNNVSSWLFKVKLLDRIKNNYVQSFNCTMYTSLVSDSSPNSETQVFSDWNELSSIVGKWKFCRIHWQWILIEQTSLYTVVYRTFLYNLTNLKVSKKAPCGMRNVNSNFHTYQFQLPSVLFSAPWHAIVK